MEDLRGAAARLLSGERGEALRTLADSREASALGASPAAEAVADAVRSGDTAALRGALSAFLATPEGRALAEKVARMGQNRG